jgi:hypothetical protein
MSIGSLFGTVGIIILACLLGPAIVAGIVLGIIFGVKKHKRNKEGK